MKELELLYPYSILCQEMRLLRFPVRPCGEPEREEYLEALVKEIRSAGDMGRGCQVSSVFLGGGTRPSLRRSRSAGFFMR